MEVKYKNEFYVLKQKERKIESEAPAVRVKMLNGETKVIGMMAPKIQVMITMPDILEFNAPLNDILEKYKSKLLVYMITSSSNDKLEEVASKYGIDSGLISNDFKNFSLKFGVNLNENLLTKSLFLIDKEGVLKFINIPSVCEDEFDLDEFEKALDEVVNFKQKGHTHENWMGV